MENNGGQRVLRVDTLAREWQLRPPQFRALEDRNNQPIFTCQISVQNWQAPTPVLPPAPMTPLPPPPAPAPEAQPGDLRQLVFRFFKLGFFEKTEIVSHLRVLNEDDKNLPELERFKLALTRAQQSNKLPELDTMIRARESALGSSVQSSRP